MLSLPLLYSTYFIIYSLFLYIFDASEFLNDYSSVVLVGTQCFVLLLGGILATFVVSAELLFGISILCFTIGSIFIECDLPKNDAIYWITLILISVSFGLFKFIFIVILLDQKDCANIKLKVGLWFIIENCCYIMVYIFLPPKRRILTPPYISVVVTLFVVGLLAFGQIFKIYKIDSHRVNIYELFRSLERQTSIIPNTDRDSKDVIISISKSTIILFILLPYGLCDSQEQYAYDYQSRELWQPNVTYYAMKHNFWPMTMSCGTIIIAMTILLCIKDIGIKIKIIIGNILMIMSVLVCAFLETCIINRSWKKKGDTWFPVGPQRFSQIIGDSKAPVTDISVFYMAPQMVLLGISEVLVIPTCIEYMYFQSTGSTKYLSIAFVLSAIMIGGISDLISMTMDFLDLFRTRLTDSHKSFEIRLDDLLYKMSSLAVLSLLLGIYLMTRFERYFEMNRPCDTNDPLMADNNEYDFMEAEH